MNQPTKTFSGITRRDYLACIEDIRTYLTDSIYQKNCEIQKSGSSPINKRAEINRWFNQVQLTVASQYSKRLTGKADHDEAWMFFLMHYSAQMRAFAYVSIFGEADAVRMLPTYHGKNPLDDLEHEHQLDERDATPILYDIAA